MHNHQETGYTTVLNVRKEVLKFYQHKRQSLHFSNPDFNLALSDSVRVIQRLIQYIQVNLSIIPHICSMLSR